MAIREIDTQAAAQSQFERNPIGAVGLVLSNVSAGLRGQELPTTALRREGIAQKDQELRQLGLTLQYAEQTVDMFSGVDRNDPQVAGQLQKWIGHISQFLPEIEDVVGASFELSDAAGRNALRNAGDYTDFMSQRCGLDGDCIKEAFANPKVIAQANEEIDQNNLQPISEKFKSIAEAVGGDTELRRIMGEDEKWSVGELRQLPPPFNFTESELRTISRNEDIQSELIPFGFEPSEISFAAAKAEATRAPSAFDEQVEALVRQGVPRDIAVKVKTGVFKAATDSLGRVTIIDLTTGEQIFPSPTEKKEAPEIKSGAAIVGGAEGTGGSAVLKNTVNAVTDFFGAGLQFEEAAAATDQLKVLKTLSMLSLAGELPGRPTNLVRERIEALFPEPSSLRIGDARSLVKLKAVRDAFVFELDAQKRIAENPEQFTPKMAQASLAASQNLGQIVEMLTGVIDNWNVKPKKAGETKFQEGDTATNAAGDKVIRKSGKWVPVK